MADTMGDLTNALLNQYSNSFPNNKSFNDIKNSIIEGMKEVLGTNKMTSDGYFYKGNTKDSQEQRSAYNDIIKNFNDEENLIKKQYALKKSHEAELAALKAKYHIISSNQEEQLAKKTLNDYKKLYEYQFDEKRKYYKQLDDEEAKIYKNSLDKGEKLTKEQLKQLKIIEEKRKAIQENWPSSMSEALKNAFSKTWKEFDVKKKIGDALNYLSDTYFFNQFKSGFSNYNAAYEQNFTSIAGRTGYGDRSETHQLITDVISEVNSTNYLNKGLNFNKDVFPEIVNATKQGFLGDEAQEVAISNAIDKKIMPWLDTSSDTWINMRYELSDDMLQSIKGQQLLLQETREGNRILQDGVASVLLDSMQPTLLNIDANTTDFNDLTEQAQGIYSYYRQFMSKQDAMKITNQMIDAYQDPSKALLNSSSTPIEKLMSMVSLNGGDVKDIAKQYSQLATIALGTNAIGRGATAGAMGINLGGWTRTESTVSKITDFEALQDMIDLMSGNDEDAKQKYLDTIGELSNYVTATQEYDNKIENTITNVLKDSTTIAHFADIGERIISNIIDIKRILIGNLVGELGNLFKNKKLNSNGISIGSKLLTGGKGVTGAIEAGSMVTNSGAGLKYAGLVGGLTQGGKSLGSKIGLTGAKATALGTAFTAGGLLAAGYGVKEAYNEFSQIGKATNTDKETKDHINSGLLATGGAVGGGMMAAAGLGLASGPVGWVGLGIAGIGLLGKTIYDTTTKIGSASAAIESEYAQQKESIRQSTQSNVNNLTDILGVLQKSTATEEEIQAQRNALMSSGLLTENDLLIAKDANKDQLEELTKAYLKSTNEFSGDIQTALDSYTAESKAWSQEAWAGMENVLQQYNDNDNGKSRNDKGYIEAASMIMNTIYSDLEKQKQNGVKLDKSSQHIYDAITKSMSNGYTADELNSIIDSGWFNEHLQSMNLSSPETIDRIRTQMSTLDSDAARNIQSAMRNGNNYYDPTETANALTYLINAKNSTSKENAIEYLDEFKKAGYKLSNYKNERSQLESKWGSDIDLKQYKLGSSYIPNDMLAILHAGERVLTANQNKEYTEELQTGNGSIIVNSIQDVVSAIQNQTKTIIDYLSTMNFNNSSGFKKMSMLPSMGNTKVTL